MHSTLFSFLKQAKVRNLYLLHKERLPKTGIYSLTDPIVKPDAPVTTYFPKAPRPKHSPDAEFSNEMMGVKKARKDFFS